MSREFHDSQKPTDLGRETTDLDETYLDREGFLPREEEEEAEKATKRNPGQGCRKGEIGGRKEEERRGGEHLSPSFGITGEGHNDDQKRTEEVVCFSLSLDHDLLIFFRGGFFIGHV